MNDARRKTLKEIVTRIEAVKELLDSIRDDISSVQDEEQESYDNMPEGLQQADRGERMLEVVDNLECAMSYISDNECTLDSVIEELATAANLRSL